MQAATPGLVQDLRAEFAVRGWIVLRQVVPARDLTALNDIFDEQMGGTPVGAAGGSARVSLRPNACRMHPALLQHLHAGVAAVAADLLGATSLRLLQDALLLKRPGARGSIALHQDYTYTGFLDPPSIVSVGLALTDAPAESGCLAVVDGSHAWGLVGGLRTFAADLEQDLDAWLSPAQRAAVERDRVLLEVQAGDVTIHHGLALHGSGDNRSDRSRKAIVTHLFSGDCRFVPDRVPPEHREHFPTDADGRLIGPAFPVLFPAEAADA